MHPLASKRSCCGQTSCSLCLPRMRHASKQSHLVRKGFESFCRGVEPRVRDHATPLPLNLVSSDVKHVSQRLRLLEFALLKLAELQPSARVVSERYCGWCL